MTLKCVSIYFIPCFWNERTSLEVFQKSASAWNLSPRRLFPVYLWSQVAANMLPSINQSRSIVAYFLINCANDLHMFGAGQAIDGSNIYKPGTAMLLCWWVRPFASSDAGKLKCFHTGSGRRSSVELPDALNVRLNFPCGHVASDAVLQMSGVCLVLWGSIKWSVSDSPFWF